MAEIRVERKRTSLLPWILGIILLALVIWGIAESMSRDRNTNTTTNDNVSAIELTYEAATALAA
jgi:putative exporter of polyketide antibiotics